MKLLLSLFFTFSISVSHAGFAEGMTAYEKGDHKTAIFNFKEAIEKEDTDTFKPLLYSFLADAYESAPEGIDNDYKLTFEAYKKSLEYVSFSSATHYTIGTMYFYGRGVEQSYIKAKEHYDLSIKHKDRAFSLWRLGKIYLHGYGVNQDYQKAIELFERSDKLKGSNATFELAHMYEYGKGVNKNIPKAIEYYRKAVVAGDGDAQYKLDFLTGKIPQSERNTNFEKALDYTYGYTVEVDFTKAIRYYQLEADKGHGVSSYNIGFIIDDIAKIKRHKEIVAYYLRSAELGNIFGQSVMASKYTNGAGVKVDLEKAFYWDRQAALQGNLSSIKVIADSYYTGIGVDKNFKKAIEWYQKAVDQNDKGSIYDLALMHEAGEGFDKDFDKALELYIQSAKLGHDKAQNELADIYFKGKRDRKDYKRSFKWAKKAADQGYADSQNKMGVFYSSGKGVVEINMETAFDWFNKAADQGSSKAFNNLAEFYSSGHGVKADANKAFKWFKKAADLGNKESQYRIGRFYKKGLVVQKDVKEALKWFKKSANKGYRDAQVAIGNIYYFGAKDSNIPKNYKKSADWYYKAAINDIRDEDDEVSMEIQVTSSGSGFFVTPNHIITNNHVTDGCDEIEVKNKGYKATVELLDTDSTTDLSILVTGKPNKSFLYLRNRKPVVTGEQSIALGYPFSSTLGSELKVTSGNIAALTGFYNNIAELQLTAPVQPGNSGGPLLDDNGNVIGVIVSRLETSSEITDDRPAQNVNFAIKSNMAKIFMDLNRVNYQVRKSNGAKKISQIVTEAKEATVQVICKEK
jgi:TPR repeat protein